MYLCKKPSGKKKKQPFNTWRAQKGGTRALHTFSLMARCVGELLPKYRKEDLCLGLRALLQLYEMFSRLVKGRGVPTLLHTLWVS